MNETQTKALDAIEKALPYLEIADKMSERDDFEQEVGNNGHPTACRTQDALYNAKLAIEGLKAMKLET